MKDSIFNLPDMNVINPLPRFILLKLIIRLLIEKNPKNTPPPIGSVVYCALLPTDLAEHSGIYG